MDTKVILRQASTEDLDFAWRLYAEAVKPYIAPYIAEHFRREWRDDYEKRGFTSWWTTKDTSVICWQGQDVGWLHFEETEHEIELVNFCVAVEFRRRGIGSAVLRELLDMWKAKQKPIAHSVLKECPYVPYFERYGFQADGEDEIALKLLRPVAASR